MGRPAFQDNCKKTCGLCGEADDTAAPKAAPTGAPKAAPTAAPAAADTESEVGDDYYTNTDKPPAPAPITSENTDKPQVPTPITSENQGRCFEGTTSQPDNTRWYTWWIGDDQRCVSVYVPPEAPKPMPIMMLMSCYSNDRNVASEFGRFPVASVTLSTDFTDGGGKGGWRTGNDGVANDELPQPCSEDDTPEISYIKAVFALIQEDTATFDSSKIYTWGFSQNSMFSAYVGFCFSHLVAGIVQGGSGLVVRSENPRAPPNLGGYCKYSDYNTLGGKCRNEAPCQECEYWPIYPCYEARPVVHCSFIYQGDPIGYPLQKPMYDRTVAEGFDSRMVEFPGGSHVEPQNKEEWYAGCLGLTEPCDSACIADFKECMAGSGKEGSLAYRYCIQSFRFPASCQSGCSPTQEMLHLSEVPAETYLSQDLWGAPGPKVARPEGSLCQHQP